VTFNYDTMLEQAISQVLGLALNTIDAYFSHPYYAIIKPHGSINWGREVDGDVVSRKRGKPSKFRTSFNSTS
jgi:hypothetical protein